MRYNSVYDVLDIQNARYIANRKHYQSYIKKSSDTQSIYSTLD
jgi:hypothetical protein